MTRRDRHRLTIRTACGRSPKGWPARPPQFVRRRRTEVFGDDVRPRRRPDRRCGTKSTPTDPVTVVDTETERLLRDRLAELRPGDPILGEEGGGAARVEPGRPLWVLDPIDGTVNFVYGIEAYAVSVGVQIDGASVAGAVANVADRRGVLRGGGPRRPRAARRGVDAAALHARRGPVDGAGGHGIRLRTRAARAAGRGAGAVAARRPRRAPRSGRARWTCAWWPRASWTRTTRTASTSGTGPRAR